MREAVATFVMLSPIWVKIFSATNNALPTTEPVLSRNTWTNGYCKPRLRSPSGSGMQKSWARSMEIPIKLLTTIVSSMDRGTTTAAF